MRTLYLALDVNPRAASGDGVHVREVTSALSRLGARITLVMPSTGEGLPVPQSDWEEVRIVQIDVTRDVTTVLECARLARSTRAELIYERRFSPKIGVAVSFLTRLPLVVEVNGLVDAEAQELASVRRRAWFPSPIRPILRRVLYSRPARVVAVTPGIARELRSRYGVPDKRLRTIPNGADLDRFRPMDRTSARESSGISIHRPVVCFVGAFYPWQGLRELVEAASHVLKALPDTLFLLVGDGPTRDEIRSLVADRGLSKNFEFTGSVPHVDVPRRIASADVCVALKSKRIGGVEQGYSPLKLYEYMACGRPVVATETAGFEILETSGAGILVDPTKAEEVASAILAILQDGVLRDRMGSRSRIAVEGQFSWRVVGQRVLEVMREATGISSHAG